MSSRQESLDLLNATHDFPCLMMFKAVGKNEDDFVGRVAEAVRQHLGLVELPPATTREAAGGRHVAVTVEPMVENAEEVLAVYEVLRDLQGIVMIL